MVRWPAQWQNWPVRVVRWYRTHLAPGDRIRLKALHRNGCVCFRWGATPGDSCSLKSGTVPGMMTRALWSVPGMRTVGTSGTERGGYDRNRLRGIAFPVSSHSSRCDWAFRRCFVSETKRETIGDIA